ncbi:MAG: nucleotide pyrophosphohydrolase [Bacteroides sp.]|nr:nucleotide pyrophosphohydrolase [Bacteroides sp.]
MTLRALQDTVDEWIRTVGVRYFSPLTNMAILAEETGEVARIMARKYGDQSFKPGEDPDALADELADLLWVLTAIANQTGVDLTEAFRRNIAKKTMRDVTRHVSNPKLRDSGEPDGNSPAHPDKNLN